ncbi:SufE family protein [soil metagenome]
MSILRAMSTPQSTARSTAQRLEEIIGAFRTAPKSLRLQLLLEYTRKVPPLPPELDCHREAMEQVHECQTPFFVLSEVDEEGRVALHFDAPQEAPTMRGFAGILAEGLSGASAQEVLEVPDDFYTRMGLAEIISSQRLRGMAAIMQRVKRQIGERTATSI